MDLASRADDVYLKGGAARGSHGLGSEACPDRVESLSRSGGECVSLAGDSHCLFPPVQADSL